MASHDQLSIPVRNEVSGLGEFDLQALAAATFHLGAAVADLDETMEFNSRLGITRWVTSGWKIARYYDVRENQAIDVRSRVAFGQLNAGLALEFIEVDRSGPVPLVWDFQDPGCHPHLAYWVDDPRAVAARLIDAGSRLLMARASTAELENLKAPVTKSGQLPAALDTCYLSGPSGLLAELVPKAIWETRLPATFGPDVHHVMPAPAQPRRRSQDGS